MTLKLSVSGVRGIFSDSLTTEICTEFAKAFSVYTNGGSIVVGTDTRPSRSIVKQAIFLGLSDAGSNIIDAGIIPTPSVSLLVREHKMDGGIVITASHNPKEWNGLKFFNNKGLFLNEKEINGLFDIWRSKKFPSGGNSSQRILEEPYGTHLSRIFEHIDVAAIGAMNFRVALDSVNGAGSKITQKLLKDLGCRVISINTNTDLEFPRNPEPTPENLKDLCNLVKKEKADIGFAQDPDADRLAIVSEKGETIGEESTLSLVVDHVLKSKIKNPSPKNIVINLSTTRAIEDIAKKYNAKVIRTKIGEINVAEEMIKTKAVIGGEGNGGVIYPPLSFNRDSLIGIALILEYMAKTKKPLSSLANSLPQYVMVKTKSKCSSKEDVDVLLEKAKNVFPKAESNTLDGLKIIFDDAWIHIRASNTEPVVRIIAEAKTRQEAENLINKVLS